MTPADLDKAEINRLRAEIERLKDELAAYRLDAASEEEEVFILHVLRFALSIPPAQARTLYRLWKGRGKLVTLSSLIEYVGIEGDEPCNTIKVHASRLRAVIGADQIQTVWGTGLSLGPMAIKTVDDLWQRFSQGDIAAFKRQSRKAESRRSNAMAAFTASGGAVDA